MREGRLRVDNRGPLRRTNTSAVRPGGRDRLVFVAGLLSLVLTAPPALAQTYRIDASDLDPVDSSRVDEEDEDALVPWRKKVVRETDPPEVKVTVPPDLVAGQQLFMNVRVTDASQVLVATLYWRYVGDPSWIITNLTGRDGRFVARFRVDRPFEYYVEAYDEWGNGPGLAGSEEAPRRVEVAMPKAQVPDAPPPPPPPPPKAPVGPPPAPMPSGRVLRVATARDIVPGRFELSLEGGLSGGSDFLAPSGSLLGQAGAARLTWGVLPVLELSLAGRAQQARLEVPSGAAYEAGAGSEFSIGGRYLSPALGSLRFALHLSSDLHLPAPGGAWAVSTEALAALTWAPSPLRVSAHAGHRWDNSENTAPGQWSPFGAFGMGVSRFDLLRFGVAVEAQLRTLVPFVEYTLDVPMNRRSFASCEGPAESCRTAPPAFPAARQELPQRVAAGVRFELATMLAIVVAGELSLTPAARGLSALDERAWPAPEAYGLPAPWSLRAALRWQFGAPLPDPKAPVPVPVPSPPVEATPTPPSEVTSMPVATITEIMTAEPAPSEAPSADEAQERVIETALDVPDSSDAAAPSAEPAAVENLP